MKITSPVEKRNKRLEAVRISVIQFFDFPHNPIDDWILNRKNICGFCHRYSDQSTNICMNSNSGGKSGFKRFSSNDLTKCAAIVGSLISHVLRLYFEGWNVFNYLQKRKPLKLYAFGVTFGQWLDFQCAAAFFAHSI